MWFSSHLELISVLRVELENRRNAISFHHVAESSARRNRSAALSACPNEKTLDTAQNLENKQPGIFLPARSMVLKVVRGKILETLGLSCLPAACGSLSEHRGNGCGAWTAKLSGIRYKLSKICYYLIDNIYNLILSALMDRVQEESGRTEDRFPNWNTGAWKRWVTTTSSFS